MEFFEQLIALIEGFMTALFSGDWDGLAGLNWDFIDDII